VFHKGEEMDFKIEEDSIKNLNELSSVLSQMEVRGQNVIYLFHAMRMLQEVMDKLVKGNPVTKDKDKDDKTKEGA
jgi:hypothetical protein